MQVVINEMKIPTLRDLFQKDFDNGVALFETTKPAIVRFINEQYLPHKLKAIVQVRSALEQDIFMYEKHLI